MAGAKRRGKKKKNTTFLQQRPPRMSSGYAACSRPSPTRSTAPLTREKNKRQCGIAALRPPSPAATSELSIRLRSCIEIARTLGNWAACLAAASFCNAKTRSISACPFKGPRHWPKPSSARRWVPQSTIASSLTSPKPHANLLHTLPVPVDQLPSRRKCRPPTSLLKAATFHHGACLAGDTTCVSLVTRSRSSPRSRSPSSSGGGEP